MEIGSEIEHRIIEANSDSFRYQATIYDQREVTLGRQAQRRIAEQISQITRRLPDSGKTMLDCGAGTGALGMHFLGAGFDVTALDLSPEMLAVFQSKAARSGYADRLAIKAGEIMSLLQATNKQYTVVGCCAFLHHVPDYLLVVDAMCRKVVPGGHLYLAWDPTVRPTSRVYRSLVQADLALDLVRTDPLGIMPWLLSRFRSRSETVELVDYHSALDLAQIKEVVTQNGLYIDSLSAFAGRRNGSIQGLCDRFQFTDHFSLIAHAE